MIVNTILFSILGGIFALIGMFVFEPSDIRNGKSIMKALFGMVLFVTGIAIVIGAHINLFTNGTAEEIMIYMFWMR